MRRARSVSRVLARWAVVVATPVVLFGVIAWWACLRMPGASHRGPLGTPDSGLVTRLRRDVGHLAGTIGSRSAYEADALAATALWIEGRLSSYGCEPRRQTFLAAGEPVANVEVELPAGSEIVVVGAHYDTDHGSPGADDNASGVAALLELARCFRGRESARTLRLVFFVNEEPPSFHTEDMGSLHYARRCQRRGEEVVAMLCLESLGCFRTEVGTQSYPLPLLGRLYGTRGDFVAFVGNLGSRRLVREALATFRDHARIPSRGVALPGHLPGVGWSDHGSFWECGYPAVMVTDTAPFRNPRYHTADDLPEHVDFRALGLAVEGLVPVVERLAGTR